MLKLIRLVYMAQRVAGTAFDTFNEGEDKETTKRRKRAIKRATRIAVYGVVAFGVLYLLWLIFWFSIQ